jgi:hypothetical protein
VYYGRHTGRPDDPKAVTTRPSLVKPGSGAKGMKTLEGYHYKKGSTGSLGVLIKGNGGRDFFGTTVPAGRPPFVGACQAR